LLGTKTSYNIFVQTPKTISWLRPWSDTCVWTLPFLTFIAAFQLSYF